MVHCKPLYSVRHCKHSAFALRPLHCAPMSESDGQKGISQRQREAVLAIAEQQTVPTSQSRKRALLAKIEYQRKEREHVELMPLSRLKAAAARDLFLTLAKTAEGRVSDIAKKQKASEQPVEEPATEEASEQPEEKPVAEEASKPFQDPYTGVRYKNRFVRMRGSVAGEPSVSPLASDSPNNKGNSRGFNSYCPSSSVTGDATGVSSCSYRETGQPMSSSLAGDATGVRKRSYRETEQPMSSSVTGDATGVSNCSYRETGQPMSSSLAGDATGVRKRSYRETEQPMSSSVTGDATGVRERSYRHTEHQTPSSVADTSERYSKRSYRDSDPHKPASSSPNTDAYTTFSDMLRKRVEDRKLLSQKK